MRAMVMHEVGGPEVMKLGELPTPKPAAGEVLIKIAYVSVNPADWKDRQGELARYYPYTFPYVVGMDAAGVIAELGEGVTQYKVGDRVVTCSNHGKGAWGTYAEYVATPLNTVAPLPANVSFEQAACIPVAGVTAWQSLHRGCSLKAGQTILVHGASGGVGSFAVQFAKHLGAKVAATCSGAKADYVRSLGVDLVIDYRTQDIAKEIKAWAPQGLDVVLDAVSCGTLPQAFDLLHKGGVLVSVPTLVGDGDVAADMQRAAELGVTKAFAVMTIEEGDKDMSSIVDLVSRGIVRVPPMQILPLEEAPKAHQLLQDGKVNGKLVLKVADL